MRFSCSPGLVYLAVVLLACLALPSDAGLQVYSMSGEGLKGDLWGNPPDAFVKVFVKDSKVGETYVVSKSNPKWDTTVKHNLAKVNDELKLQVWDKDLKNHDLLGVCYAQVTRGSFTHPCTLSKGGTLTYSYKFE